MSLTGQNQDGLCSLDELGLPDFQRHAKVHVEIYRVHLQDELTRLWPSGPVRGPFLDTPPVPPVEGAHHVVCMKPFFSEQMIFATIPGA
jgi:hypothetical protein